MSDKEEPLSYHDVVVHCNGQSYCLFDRSYGLVLTCSRSSGWELWNRWAGAEELIGGEYSGAPFCVTVAGRAIVGTLPLEVASAE